MKLLLLTTLVFSALLAAGQDDLFRLTGKIVDNQLRPIPDAYIINFRDVNQFISNANGEFNIWVQRGDSLMISHVSYYRKKVYADSVKNKPVIQLKLDTINIMHVNIFSKPRSEEAFARENINSWEFSIIPSPTEAFTEKERIQNVLNSENKIMRSEASSVRIATFSPSSQLGKVLKWIKRRKKSNEYSNTKKK